MAVTGIGVVSPLGDSAQELFDAARAGRSAIRRIAVPLRDKSVAALAASADFDGSLYFDRSKLRLLDRSAQFALVAARRAIEDSGLALSDAQRARTGVFLGTGMGGSHTLDDGYLSLYGDGSDRIKPQLVLMGMHNAAAAWIGIDNRVCGPNLTYSTACSSSAVAIGEAWLRVARGDVDFAFAGGSEAPLAAGSLLAWAALRALASVDAADAAASCKPFAANRTGMVLGEGAAMFVLEPWEHAMRREAFSHGEVIGYGLATDIAHIARPSVAGQAAAMHAALQCAGIDAARVRGINAHATGTQANDGTETAAIKQVFGTHAHAMPISATKALHGHLLGAAGALECVLALKAMQNSVALPTMHLQIPDPECDLDYVPNRARAADIDLMLSNSFAFGGTNAVLALRRAAG